LEDVKQGVGEASPSATPAAPAAALPERRRIPRTAIVNLVNRVNFRDGEVLLAFRDSASGLAVPVPATPLPCRGEEFDCRWLVEGGPAGLGERLVFEGFTLSDGLRRIHVPATLVAAGPGGARLALPATGFDIGTRGTRRHRCPDVEAQVHQGGRTVVGGLASFSASSFAVRCIEPAGAALDAQAPARVLLRRGGEVLFDEECRLVRAGDGTAVFSPVSSTLRRFKAKRIRSERQRPRPLPVVTFVHPLTGARIALRATDISGAGVGVEEEARRAVLLPGLVLPEVRVEFLPGSAVTFRALVLHGAETADGSRRSGLAILDMDPGEHVRLCAIVHRCRDEDSHVCTTNVDLEALWDFFFETGFLYPEKYAFIHRRKESFVGLYERLYHRSPAISRHIIYQDRGRIYGHVSMLRFYRQTWILHHHAAIRSVRHNAGMVVQEQILRYINEFHHLPSARMRYLAAYYRPDNRYAGRVLGGAVRLLGDPQRCSLDAFAYLHCVPAGAPPPLPPGWDLAEAGEEDLAAFSEAYRASSGGLLDRALDLVPGADDGGELDREYAGLGFLRGRRLLALRDGAGTAALLALNRSDVGLNLSDLTNCLQVFLPGPGRVDRSTLEAALARAAAAYPPGPVPTMVHPREAAEACGLPYEKIYALSVVDLEHYGAYLEAIMSFLGPRTRAGRERRG